MTGRWFNVAPGITVSERTIRANPHIPNPVGSVKATLTVRPSARLAVRPIFEQPANSQLGRWLAAHTVRFPSTILHSRQAPTMDFSTTHPNVSPELTRQTFDGDDPNWAIAVKQPAPTVVQDLTPSAPPAAKAADLARASTVFVPREPTSFAEAGLREPQVEALVLKFLLNTGGNTGREIAEQIALPFAIVQLLLQRLKNDQLEIGRAHV